MSWIQCGLCRLVPCQCITAVPATQWSPATMVPQYAPMPYTFTPRLSDEDVERIAKKLAAELAKLAGGLKEG